MKKILLGLILLSAIFGFVNATPLIEADVTDGDAPLTVHFMGITTHENITAINWYFEDGGVSHELNPVHTFTDPGKYSVKLEIWFENSRGSSTGDINTKTAFISVGEGFKNKILTTDQLQEHSQNSNMGGWTTDKDINAYLASSALNVAATPTLIPKPTATATSTILKTMAVTSIETTAEKTAPLTATETSEPTETYNAKEEIELLKEQNAALQAQVNEQGNLLDKIWDFISGLMGGAE